MRRRELITLIGGMAAIPFAARAQQSERTRRIGALSSVAEDSESKALQAVFRQALEQLGWTDGRNVQVVTRFGQGDTARTREYAAEMVALAPDVILSCCSYGAVD